MIRFESQVFRIMYLVICLFYIYFLNTFYSKILSVTTELYAVLIAPILNDIESTCVVQIYQQWKIKNLIKKKIKKFNTICFIIIV